MSSLEPRLVGDIAGHFVVPSYQRGYRWSAPEVTALLRDIQDNGPQPYCLQPVVVRRLDIKADTPQYELIDGQQRLTTLYLIYAFFEEYSKGFIHGPKWTMDYVVRPDSTDFLRRINEPQSNQKLDCATAADNPDFWHMTKAKNVIADFFGPLSTDKITDFNKYLAQNVSVLWYEVPASEDGNALFRRLNIGKIPLTSSELVKALFMRDAAGDGAEVVRQDEIALQWDAIETRLHAPSFWAFLTNESTDAYPTRIDLILDLMAEKPSDCREKYHTFFYFNDLVKTKPLKELWQDIYTTFLTLEEWYASHEFYHKVGYLIACGQQTLQQIFKAYAGDKRKSQLQVWLDKAIRASVAFDKNKRSFNDLNYLDDHWLIGRILLLFNVVTCINHAKEGMRFPFDLYKDQQWSLEHIHAQNSNGPNTNQKRLLWLDKHLQSLQRAYPTPDEKVKKLIDDADKVRQRIRDTRDTTAVGEAFERVRGPIFDLLSAKDADFNEHSIANMALLSAGDNAALNDGAFDVKRSYVVQWDKEGRWIPYCTRMVFYKYYSGEAAAHLYFWEPDDRRAYLDEMLKVLNPYL